MREVPDSISAAWNEGLFIGNHKPIARVTVQHPQMYLRNYSLMSTFRYKKVPKVKDVEQAPIIDLTHGRKVHQQYADFLFTGSNDLHAYNVKTALNALYVAAGSPNLVTLGHATGLNAAVMDMWLKGVTTPAYAPALKMVIGLHGDVLAFSKTYKEKATLEAPKELPNVRSVAWTRSVDTDVADCTIECWNTKPLEVGESPREGELDLPGYYTYDRGGTAFSRARWGHVRNDWFGMLVPDNIVRTYEGYGYDKDAPPELDPFLVQTGTWLIDSVQTNDRGTLIIKARDIGRILLDQMYYAPVVPDDFYNEDWQGWKEDFPGDPVKTKVKLKLKAEDSSNTSWIGGRAVTGHKLSYAFDGDPNTYWLSIGNVAASRRFAYEWVQATVDNKTVSTVRVRTKKKNYTAYVSVMVGGVWQGKGKINYHEDGIGHNGGDINYVKSVHIDTEGFVTIDLGKNYAKVERIRVTVGNLQNFHFGPYQYRGGIRDVEAYGVSTKAGKDKHLTVGPAGSNPNRYSDYTDIVKLLCAWGGFFWPSTGRQRISNGTYYPCAPVKFDTSVLGAGVKGRIWGDFQQSGTFGPAPLSLTNFDKKPLLSAISYVRDILGFMFYIDEIGSCVWRQPNIQDYGSRWSAFSERAGQYVDGFAHLISEDSVLLELSTTLDSKNVREANFVGDVLGKIGGFAPGFNPNPTGLRRIGGWTDQNFEKQEECIVMADLISLRQLFTYRIDRLKIPANPAIQIDDQLRIVERTSAEGYVHYCKSIASNLDMTSGEWTYDMETHWLGYDNPESKWLFHPEQLDTNTQKFLADLNKTKKSRVESLADAATNAKAAKKK